MRALSLTLCSQNAISSRMRNLQSAMAFSDLRHMLNFPIVCVWVMEAPGESTATWSVISHSFTAWHGRAISNRTTPNYRVMAAGRNTDDR